MPTLSYNKFRQFQEDVYKGVHNFTSDSTCTLTVALCAAANAPVNTNSVLADLTPISNTNLSSRVITGVTCEQSGGTVTLTADDLTLTASGTVADFRYIVIYNDDPTSPADPLLCWFDYGSTVSMTNGQTFLVEFPSDLFTSS